VGCEGIVPVKKLPILIIDQDAHFREELYNFLLSEGYENVVSVRDLTEALEKIGESEYDVVVLDASSHLEAGVRSAASITGLSPKARVILMVSPDDRSGRQTKTGERLQCLIKAMFARNLLYLLEKDAESIENQGGE
jgi:DNA-binding NtrC family response regulator